MLSLVAAAWCRIDIPPFVGLRACSRPHSSPNATPGKPFARGVVVHLSTRYLATWLPTHHLGVVSCVHQRRFFSVTVSSAAAAAVDLTILAPPSPRSPRSSGWLAPAPRAAPRRTSTTSPRRKSSR